MLLKQLLVGDLIAMLIALCMTTAVAAWLARKVTLPLTELRDFVRRIERGNLSSRLEVKSNDEFGELTHAINQMAEGLEERESLKGALVDYFRSQAADTKLKRTEGEQTENLNRGISTRPLLCPVDEVDCDSVRLVIDQANEVKEWG